jgi:hypothetical protein
MYSTFVEERRSEREIADLLNARGVLTDLSRAWTRGAVHQVLINEKYIGNNVWKRSSFKLKRRRLRNDPNMWIRSDGAFEPIVERLLFDAAQAIIIQRSYRLSNEQMLDTLRALLESMAISRLIIDECGHSPSSSAYQCRFGSLLRAYELVGYPSAPREAGRARTGPGRRQICSAKRRTTRS